MLIHVDNSSPVPLSAQIAQQVRASVVSGEAAEGERLPSARDLAAALQINIHTVLRGYSALREAGIVEMRRGRTARIAQGASRARVQIEIRAMELLSDAKKLGISQAELISIITGNP